MLHAACLHVHVQRYTIYTVCIQYMCGACSMHVLLFGSGLLLQDLPLEWPWGKVETVAPATSKGRGRGGRGRGRKSKDDKPDDHEGKQKEQQQQKNNKAKESYLLANLVRAGNQMKSSSSWEILQRSVLHLISKSLVLRPQSKLPSLEVRLGRQARNRRILTLLGKLPGPDTPADAKQPRVWATAAELLQHLDWNYVCQTAVKSQDGQESNEAN